jgi:hypothetical protein
MLPRDAVEVSATVDTILLGSLAVTIAEPWLGYPPAPIACLDPEIDRHVCLFGDPDVVRALMDKPAREAIRQIFSTRGYHGLSLGGRVAKLVGRVDATVPGEAVTEAIRALARLADGARLSRGTLTERLLANVLEEELFEVRADNMRRLLDRIGRDSERKRLDVLRRMLTGPNLTPPEIARGVQELGTLPYTRTREIVLAHLSAASVMVRAAAIEVIAAHRDDSPIDAILEDVTTDDEDLGRAVVRALAGFASDRARAGLVEVLRHPSRDVVTDAIAALGAVGSVDAVQHLERVGGWFIGDRGLAKAARAAIAKIQARDGTRAPGALSIARPEGEGALSEAPPVGALSDRGR